MGFLLLILNIIQHECFFLLSTELDYFWNTIRFYQIDCCWNAIRFSKKKDASADVPICSHLL